MIAYYHSSNNEGAWIFWAILIGIGAISLIINYIKENQRTKELYHQTIDSLRKERSEHLSSKKRIEELEVEKDRTKLLVESTLLDWKRFGAMLPSLREWSDKVRCEYDSIIEAHLRNKSRPAVRSADEVKKALAKARESKKEAERLTAQLAISESQAPWLAQFTDYSVEEIIEGIEEEEELKEIYQKGEDPVSLFVPIKEWKELSVTERNQRALDRYWNSSRKKTAWSAGVQYERFIGYQYESQGFKVNYHGALEGREDLGIDLVCSKNGHTHIVQCKRLSEQKGIPVRENVIAQVYGSALFYAMENDVKEMPTAVLITTYECSEMARKFAKHLGVVLRERFLFKPYPCIKCNISRTTGEKIYHLPFDQQYDKTSIGDVEGDFYASSILEAEAAGFRRAFRWTGNA